MLINRTCALMAPRDISSRRFELIYKPLRREVLRAIEDGYTHFISQLEPGLDLCCATVVTELQEQGASITLEAILSRRERILRKSKMFWSVLRRCTAVGVCDAVNWVKSNQHAREVVVENCSRLIVILANDKRNDTTTAIHVMHGKNRDVRMIRISIDAPSA